METADVDILREARSRLTLAADVRGAGLIGLLRQADRSFEQAGARSFRAVNRAGFMVDLLKSLPKDRIRDDTRLFALHKFWLAEQPDREPLKKGRDRAQGQAVLRLVLERLPQYPLDARVLKGLPVDVRTPKLKVPRNI